ncbi:MAG: 3D-(3,5/4)-trihydroxycyclohexane-1,2-dione acylhydrolase (decyclizing) [Deinococcales bacterium]
METEKLTERMSERMTERMTVAQALMRFLSQQYSERDGQEMRLIAGLWGIMGHGNVTGLGQAMQECGQTWDMPFYRPQNEQAQVHIAAAYAKHTNRMSTFACTASVGPGSSNMVTGAALATINRLPVLLLPSDFFANRIPDPVLQQVEHPSEHDLSVNDIFRPVSRFYTRISRPEQLIHALPEAMRILTDPAETGAVTISLPEDVQAEAYDWPVSMFKKRVWRIRRPVPEPEMIAEAVKLIKKAKHPMIVMGGGVTYSGANEALADFVSRYSIPCGETQAGKGAIPWDHPMNLGAVGATGGSAANQIMAEADLVIAIGTRLGDFTSGSKTTFPADATLIGINVCAMDAYKMFALPIVADAKRCIEALSEALEKANYKGLSQAKQKKIAKAKAEWDAIVDEIFRVKEPENLAQGEVIGMVNKIMGYDATMICAAGSMPGDLHKLWRPSTPKSYHVEYGYSCMGYEIPAGLGVHMAETERQVVVMVGDGSYLMMNSEIVTAVVEGHNLTIVIIDNHGYQSIHGLQRSCGTPHFALELRYRNAETGLLDGAYVPINFAQHAAAMGAKAVTVTSEAALREALEEAKATYGVKVIEVKVDPEKRVGGYAFGGWWEVPIAEVSKQESVNKAREAYQEARKKQVLFK